MWMVHIFIRGVKEEKCLAKLSKFNVSVWHQLKIGVQETTPGFMK